MERSLAASLPSSLDCLFSFNVSLSWLWSMNLTTACPWRVYLRTMVNGRSIPAWWFPTGRYRRSSRSLSWNRVHCKERSRTVNHWAMQPEDRWRRRAHTNFPIVLRHLFFSMCLFMSWYAFIQNQKLKCEKITFDLYSTIYGVKQYLEMGKDRALDWTPEETKQKRNTENKTG